MIEHLDLVATPDGKMQTLVVHPSEGGPFPLVIIYMDVWGIREELRDIARQVAAVGYCCVLPDLYHHQGKVQHEFRDPNGRMMSLELLTDAQKEQVRAPLRKTTDAMVMSYTGALLDHAMRLPAASCSAVGAVGYCMGGRHVMVAAGTFPDRIAFVASLHGTNLATDAQDSPHRMAARSHAEVYCGYGELDPFAAPETVRAVDAELRGANKRHRYEVHPQARHGYALPDRDVYDKFATNRDWEMIFAGLRRMGD